jgi:hypothetical protein
MRWRQVDFDQKTITIGKVKSVAGTGRVIPMNNELLAVMSSHAKWFTEILGEIRADFCVFHRSYATYGRNKDCLEHRSKDGEG